MKCETLFGIAACFGLSLFITGCKEGDVTAQPNKDGGMGPVVATVQPDMDSSNFSVRNPERFHLVPAAESLATSDLNVTGVVSPDVSRQVPVPSLATGRIIEIHARLGDSVRQGQLLFKVRSNDIAGAYSDYRKAVKNADLAKMQLDRARILFDDGAIPKSGLEVAQNNEHLALVDVETTTERLHLLGADPTHPSGIVEVCAPVSGVITDQQITTSAGVQALTPPNPFTISDISHVWIVCDVYENNLEQVHVGEYADVHVAAYPNRILRGLIRNIMPVMDPNLRTAKVRLEMENPGMLRFGMFVTATFHGSNAKRCATIPMTAILHLHDREWVYMPNGNGSFRRQEVVTGKALADNWQEIISGVKPGEKVIENALVFQNTAEQ
jgi:cobalt-zinc-cadmium efflux system membrane fusion protein